MNNLGKTFSEVVTCGEKRKSTSPLASKAKEPTMDLDIPDSEREEVSAQLEAISNLNNSSYIPNTNVQPSKTTFKAASVASFGNHWERGLTDMVQLEFISFNGQAFNISIARPEVMYVWTDVIGVDPSLIFGISFKKPMNRGLMASIKLKKQIRIDDLFSKPDFSYNRGQAKSDGSYDIVTGKILGLRTPPPQAAGNNQPSTPGFTRVNVYGLAFDIDKEKVESWLKHFGEVLEFDDIMDKDLPDLATGDISAKMKLRKNNPCFLPLYGKKIRIAYRGMPTICSNCFDVGHIRINCHNRRVAWLDYVKNIYTTGRFKDELFGKWIGIMRANELIPKYGPTKQPLPNIPEATTEPIDDTTDAMTPPAVSTAVPEETSSEATSSVATHPDDDGQEQRIDDDRTSQNSQPRSFIGTLADYLLNK